jgi:hypothetical protein
MDELVRICRDHGVREVYIETNNDVYDTYFPMAEARFGAHRIEPGTNLAFPDGWSCTLERRHSTVQKELRIIETLEPVISSHRLIVDPGTLIPAADESLDNALQRQIAAITFERKSLPEEGKLDALAGAVKEWQHTLRLDTKTAERVSKTREIERLWQEHQRLTAVGPLEEPRWHRR